MPTAEYSLCLLEIPSQTIANYIPKMDVYKSKSKNQSLDNVPEDETALIKLIKIPIAKDETIMSQ